MTSEFHVLVFDQGMEAETSFYVAVIFEPTLYFQEDQQCHRLMNYRASYTPAHQNSLLCVMAGRSTPVTPAMAGATISKEYNVNLSCVANV